MTASTDNSAVLLGVAEVAELLNVTKQSVSNWRGREKTFPQPVVELKSGPVWRSSAIEAWAKQKGLVLGTLHAGKKSPDARIGETVIVSLVNMKGGVGKSTLTANLGWHFSYNLSLRVLLVDLDPQFNLSQYTLGLERYKDVLAEQNASVYDVFEQATSLSPRKKRLASVGQAVYKVDEWDDGSCLHLVPSRLELAMTLKNPHHKNRRLKPFLDELRDDYDLILIDCPPTESVLTEAAYLASNFILVPVKPDYLSTIGLPLLAESLNEFKKEYPDSELRIAGIVFNSVNPSKNESRLAISDVQNVAKEHKWYVFNNMISASDSYPRGARSGKSISKTGYARTEKILEFSEFSEELSGRIGL